ncbi:hypothetical protein [Bacillus sp. FJAT-50079]|uniref:hypothetical protein n=1 Tax=Bacillus sp. FJAT-50079 TaxID=2833577 RepID=UPI001BCA25A0|nr:hypothetical protein [Bacillus sp. FJAT-50079]MBS4209385.1 hypothetical protein [Bacillus sp. FJAT-50079]
MPHPMRINSTEMRHISTRLAFIIVRGRVNPGRISHSIYTAKNSNATTMVEELVHRAAVVMVEVEN